MEFLITEDFHIKEFEGNLEQFLEDEVFFLKEGVSRSNIFERIWSFIKKCVDWIINKFKSIYRYFFNPDGDKVTDTTTNIMDEVMKDIDKATDNEMLLESSKHKTIVKFRKSMTATRVNTITVDDLMEDIVLQYRNGDFVFKWDDKYIPSKEGRELMSAMKMDEKSSKRIHVGTMDRPDMDAAMSPHMVFLLVALMDKSVEKVLDIIESCAKHKSPNRDYMDEMFEISSKYFLFDANDRNWQKDFTIKDFEDKVIKPISRLGDVMNKVDLDGEYSRNESSGLSQVSNFIVMNQRIIMAFTMMCYKIKLQVPMKYYGKVNSLKTLSKIARRMLDANIPPKYIMLNMYLIASKKLKGPESNENAPVYGLTRMILFPEDKRYVIKIATSKGLGVVSNRNELHASNVFNKIGLSDSFAKTYKEYENYAVLVSERIIPGPKGNVSLEDMAKNINDVLKDNGYSQKIEDIYDDNVIYDKDGKPVIIDYGLMTFSHDT